MEGAGCVCGGARTQPRAMWPETPSRVPHLGSPERRSVGPPRVRGVRGRKPAPTALPRATMARG